MHVRLKDEFKLPTDPLPPISDLPLLPSSQARIGTISTPFLNTPMFAWTAGVGSSAFAAATFICAGASSFFAVAFLVDAFLAFGGLTGSRDLAAAVLSCAGVCCFCSDAALFFVDPLELRYALDGEHSFGFFSLPLKEESWYSL